MKDSWFSIPSAHAGVIADAPTIPQILIHVLQFLLSVVGIVAILAIVITGLRLLLVQDTRQAESLKKSLFAIIVGLIIVMGSFVLVLTIGNFLQ